MYLGIVRIFRVAPFRRQATPPQIGSDQALDLSLGSMATLDELVPVDNRCGDLAEVPIFVKMGSYSFCEK